VACKRPLRGRRRCAPGVHIILTNTIEKEKHSLQHQLFAVTHAIHPPLLCLLRPRPTPCQYDLLRASICMPAYVLLICKRIGDAALSRRITLRPSGKHYATIPLTRRMFQGCSIIDNSWLVAMSRSTRGVRIGGPLMSSVGVDKLPEDDRMARLVKATVSAWPMLHVVVAVPRPV
jgi:hypothetical protein